MSPISSWHNTWHIHAQQLVAIPWKCVLGNVLCAPKQGGSCTPAFPRHLLAHLLSFQKVCIKSLPFLLLSPNSTPLSVFGDPTRNLEPKNGVKLSYDLEAECINQLESQIHRTSEAPTGRSLCTTVLFCKFRN